LGVKGEVARRAPISMIPPSPPPCNFLQKLFSPEWGTVFGMFKYLSRNPWQRVGCKGGGAKGNPTMSAPFGKPPPSPPDKYSPRLPPPKVVFMDTIKGKTEPTRKGEYLSGGEGGGFPKGADHFFIPLSPPLYNRRSAMGSVIST